MLSRIQIGKCTLTGVLRYRWESRTNDLRDYGMWKEWSLSIWFKTYKAVGRKNFKQVDKWGSNLKTCYMFGVDLLIVKLWVDIDFGAMHLGIKK